MYINDLMSSKIVSVEMDDNLNEVKNIFDSTSFHHLLVIDYDKLVGVISERDLLRAISPNVGTLAESDSDHATLNKKAHQIMSRKPITLTANQSIDDAIQLFNTHDISCIPIVDSANKPIGILSWRDILKNLHLK